MTDQPQQSRELAVAKQIAGHLQKMEPEYRAVLPAHITPEAFTRIAQTAIQLNEDLQECTQRSLIASCTRLAEMGLQPDGKEAALVAFNVKVKRRNPQTGQMVETWEKRATPMPMVEGLRDLVRRSGQVKNWKARVVRQGDFFKHIDGDEESLVHEPQHDIDQPITHVYSIAYLENGELARHVMPIAAVEKIRRRSKNADRGPWVDHYAEMVLKTCMKQQSKYLPKAKDDLNRARFVGALRALDEADGFEPEQRQDVPRLSMQQATSERLRLAVDAQVFEDEEDEQFAACVAEEIRRGPQHIVREPSSAKVESAPISASAPAQEAPKATRKRRTTAERIADNLAQVNAKQPPAAAGNGYAAHAAAPAPESAISQPATKATQSVSATTAPAAAAAIDEGRDLEFERQEFERETAADMAGYDGAQDDTFLGDIPPGEADGEEPEVLAYRDGWHTRSGGKPRVPPTSIKSAQEAECWFKGYDAYKTAVDLGNAPQSSAASEAMLDRMVGQVFA